MVKRDDFSPSTKRLLAERVAFRCSYCGKPTIGPSHNKDESSSVGVASHICAASPGGPRYDESMKEEQRKHHSNGIWLCQSHARLIDVDIDGFPVDKLHTIKGDAEERARQELHGELMPKLEQKPRLQGEILWFGVQQRNLGLNFEATAQYAQGRTISPLEKWYNYDLIWKYKLTLYNTSSAIIHNIQIANTSEGLIIGKLRRHNSLRPTDSIELQISYIMNLTSMGSELKELRELRLPDEIKDESIDLVYEDGSGNKYSLTVPFEEH